jgi:hypothetical protein
VSAAFFLGDPGRNPGFHVVLMLGRGRKFVRGGVDVIVDGEEERMVGARQTQFGEDLIETT